MSPPGAEAITSNRTSFLLGIMGHLDGARGRSVWHVLEWGLTGEGGDE